MACNCSSKNANKVWVFTSKDGATTKTYRTEIEARARVIREGGGRIVAQPA